MSTSADIIEAALTWVGTPYHHKQRLKGVGVDCAHFVAGVAIETGRVSPDIELPFDYSAEWNMHNEEQMLLSYLEKFGCRPKDTTEPGDIVCFTIGRAVGHIGIMIDETRYVHAQNMVRPYQVVVNTLSDKWKKRHTHTYSFPGA